MIAYIMFKLMHRLVLVLPRRWSYWIGSRVADMDYLFRKDLCKAVRSNIKHILNTAESGKVSESIIRVHTKAVFRNFAKYLVDFFSFSKFTLENLHKIVKIKGLENMREAFNRGKGVIGLTAHLGNWELAAVAAALAGFSINIVALSHENTKINRLFVNQRMMKGINVIPVGAGARQYLNVLKKNELIALVGDRLTSDAGIEIQFFNRPTVVPRGPAALSLKTGAAIVPAFMIRTPEDNYDLIFEKPIEPREFSVNSNPKGISRGVNIAESEKKLTQYMVSILEKYIKKYPSQWFLFYKVWS